MSSPRVLPRIVEGEIACKENRVTRLCHFKMDVCKNTRCSVTGARGGLSTTDYHLRVTWFVPSQVLGKEPHRL